MSARKRKMTAAAIRRLVREARAYMCIHCKNPKRGGRRRGAELCQDCYEGDNYL